MLQRPLGMCFWCVIQNPQLLIYLCHGGKKCGFLSFLAPIPLVTSEQLSLKRRALGMPLLCNLSPVVQVLGLLVCFLKSTRTVRVVLQHIFSFAKSV